MPERERPRGHISPLSAAIIAALVGLLGTWIGAFIQGRSNLALEQKKFESALILKAIETGDPEKATVNLLFLINAGFIRDANGKIAHLANQPATVPVLPQTGPPRPKSHMGPLESESNRNGSDISSFQVNTAKECSSACAQDERCKAMTFVKHPSSPGGICWLKDRVPPRSRDPGMDSAVKIFQ